MFGGNVAQAGVPSRARDLRLSVLGIGPWGGDHCGWSGMSEDEIRCQSMFREAVMS